MAKFFDVSIDSLLGDESAPQRENDGAESLSAASKTNSGIFESALKLVRRKGYIAGYIVCAYRALALGIARIAHAAFKRMILPEGFDITLADVPAHVKTPLYFTDIISVLALALILFGIGLALYLKRKKRSSEHESF